MLGRLRRYRQRILFIFVILFGLIVPACLVFDVRDLCAHSPHDPIDALELSPNYDQDKTLFIVVLEQLLRSRDGGSSWKELVNGLDNRYRFTSIAISPSYHSDGTVFVASDGDGVYRSQDGGESWAKANDGLGSLNIGLLAISANYHSDQTVLASLAEGGLYKSENGGENWYRVMGDIKVTAIAFSPDPKKDQVFVGDSGGTLYLSTDGGKIWQRIFRISDAGAVTTVAVSPNFSSDDTVFVGTDENGIFKSVDGGLSFTNVMSSRLRGKYGTFRISRDGPFIRRSEENVISVAISPAYETDSTVFASLWNEAVFRSEDGGNTWERYTLGLTCDYQADSDKHRSPHFRSVRISRAFAEDKAVFLGGFDGLLKSTDGGHHWIQLETFPVRLIAGLALSPGDNGILSVAVTTYGGGAYITCDQRIAWTVHNTGLENTRLVDIVFSPSYSSDNTILSGSQGHLLRSTDRGNRWESISLSRPTSWRKRISSVLRRLGLPWFITRTIASQSETYPHVFAISPNFAFDGTMYIATRGHGIFRSVERGTAPSIVWDGLGRLITSLVISPGFSSDKTLFAGVYGAGVYKSVDGGDTWQPANNGLAFVEAWQSLTGPQITRQGDVLLVISPHYSMDQTVFVASSEGLFKTTDGGTHWQELKDAVLGESSYIIAVGISPSYRDDGTLIVSIRGRGLFRTDDSGATFTQVGSRLIDNNYAIKYIEFSPLYGIDHTVYVASDEELFKSTDRGNTWEIIARPMRYENMREAVNYEGEWQNLEGESFSASSVSCSSVTHSKAILNFVGTGVSWIGTESSDQGIARVYVDGNYVGDVDQFGDTRRTMVRSFSVTDLPYGPHTIVIEVMHFKNPGSSGYRIEVDAFDVVP